MAWDNVPWFVGGGALHSPEVARLLAFAAFGGAEGVVQGADLKVTALPVATSKVRVNPGACSILSRATGGEKQAYAGRLLSADDIDISSTGSSGGRVDMVIARVEDPFMAGEPWQDPADPTVGPYIFTRVLPNVPASAVASPEAAADYLAEEGESAIAIAGVTLPANTGTVTDGMISDLRQVAQPRSKRVHRRVDLGIDAQIDGALGVVWTTVPVRVPSWATKAILRADLSGVRIRNAAFTGVLIATLGPAAGPKAETGITFINEGVWDTTRTSYFASASVDIPAELRGTTRDFYMQAARIGGTGVLFGDAQTQLIFDVEFIETTS